MQMQMKIDGDDEFMAMGDDNSSIFDLMLMEKSNNFSCDEGLANSMEFGFGD